MAVIASYASNPDHGLQQKSGAVKPFNYLTSPQQLRQHKEVGQLFLDCCQTGGGQQDVRFTNWSLNWCRVLNVILSAYLEATGHRKLTVYLVHCDQMRMSAGRANCYLTWLCQKLLVKMFKYMIQSRPLMDQANGILSKCLTHEWHILIISV